MHADSTGNTQFLLIIDNDTVCSFRLHRKGAYRSINAHVTSFL